MLAASHLHGLCRRTCNLAGELHLTTALSPPRSLCTVPTHASHPKLTVHGCLLSIPASRLVPPHLQTMQWMSRAPCCRCRCGWARRWTQWRRCGGLGVGVRSSSTLAPTWKQLHAAAAWPHHDQLSLRLRCLQAFLMFGTHPLLAGGPAQDHHWLPDAHHAGAAVGGRARRAGHREVHPR